MSLAFIVLRAINLYGDPSRWATQSSGVFTAISFLNTTKYPPSLLFLLMTLGPAMIVMSWFDRRRFSAANPMIVFGRVPFFFFVVHLAFVHILAVLLSLVRYGWNKTLFMPPPSMGSMRNMFPANYGYDLWVVFAVWVAAIAMLYPLCRWFADVKQRRRDWWLSYL